ncbi:uncharacterized protein LOC134095648 [Sardina pilchardus]|uniref:uncharacterized protein LOC134095648 n=1 Tax=Sardina pilchardus TaxID=27697 RepID=UPI002E111523
MCVLLPHMRAFTGLVLLVTSTYGLDSVCDADQDSACYGALGGPVYLQLMRNARGYDLSLSNGSSHVFIFRKSKSVFYNEFNTPSVLQRWQFVPDNGTMIINSTERRDAGTYRVEIIDESTGKSVGGYTVELTIEAPMSDVDLSIRCSAYGDRRAMCSSNGDSPLYSWSLNGRPLNETSSNQCLEKLANTSAEAPQSSPGCITDLLEGTQGNLTCLVRNSISSTSKTQPLPSCTTTATPTTTPTAPTAMTTSNGVSMATNKPTSTQTESKGQQIYVYSFISVIIVLTSPLVGGYYLYRRNRKRSHPPGGASMTARAGTTLEYPTMAPTLVSSPSDERKDQKAQSDLYESQDEEEEDTEEV